MTQTMYGYGVDLSVLSKEDFNFKKLRRKLPEDVRENYRSFLNEDGPKKDVDATLYDFLSEYESANGTRGICAFLADLISEREGVRVEAFDEVRTGYLYVAQKFPFHFNGKERKMTEEDWNALFRKHVGLVTDQDLLIEVMPIYLD